MIRLPCLLTVTVFLYCPDSYAMGSDPDITTRLGYCYCSFLQQLGILHTARLHANLLQASSAFTTDQQTQCKSVCQHWLFCNIRDNSLFPQSIVLSGVYSAIPYFLLALLIPTGGFIADALRMFIPTGIVRRIMTTCGEQNGCLFCTHSHTHNIMPSYA